VEKTAGRARTLDVICGLLLGCSEDASEEVEIASSGRERRGDCRDPLLGRRGACLLGVGLEYSVGRPRSVDIATTR